MNHAFFVYEVQLHPGFPPLNYSGTEQAQNLGVRAEYQNKRFSPALPAGRISHFVRTDFYIQAESDIGE